MYSRSRTITASPGTLSSTTVRPRARPRAQRAALVWAVVRDGVERAVDVVHTDAVAPDRHQLVCAGRDLVDSGYDVLTPLRQPGRFVSSGTSQNTLTWPSRAGTVSGRW